jgi:hypothetical protein
MVTLRKRPDTMQMIRQEDPSLNTKGVPCSHLLYRRPQGLSGDVFAKYSLSLMGDHSEKVYAPWCSEASVVWHEGKDLSVGGAHPTLNYVELSPRIGFDIWILNFI